MKRTYFLQTSDPDLVIVVPSVDGDITIADRNDPPEYVERLPEPHEFTLTDTLNDAALAEIAEAVAEYNEWNAPIMVNYERMAVQFSDD